MKKLVSVLLALVLCLGLVPAAALAADVPYPVTGGNLLFDSSTGTVTKCEGAVTSADIPAEIYGTRVTAIGRGAFFGCGELQRVSIPNTVTAIGENAFAGCRNLAAIDIPSSVTAIGSGALSQCRSLTSVVIPDSVTEFGGNMFFACENLTFAALPAGITSVPKGCFSLCERLQKVEFPKSLTVIEDSAFMQCRGLSAVTIPEGVTEIKYMAFYNCANLKEVSLPGSLKTLASSAFAQCGFQRVVIPNGVERMGDNCFGYCKDLSSVEIPVSVQSIGQYAFATAKLKDIYYGGGTADWSAMNISRHGNDNLFSASIHFNSKMPAVSVIAHDWARPELEKAEEMGLIPDVLQGQDLTAPITRAEFAAVAVKVFENLSGAKALPDVTNPFTDTRDAEVLKAFNIGAVNGTSATTFTPDALLNREQCATMLTRVFKRCTMAGWTLAADSQFKLSYAMPAKFADDKDISGYARDSVYFMAANGIINGVGGNRFAPKNTTSAQEAQGYANATREQALAIAVRMVENLG